MANYLVTDTQLTSVADAIRAKTGQSGGLSFPDGMVSAIGEVQTGGGGEDLLEQTLNNTLISYTNSNVTTIKNYAFYQCSALTTISFPAATNIGNSAFQYCYSLTTASFPSVTSIGNNVFQYCSALTTVSFPKATSIGISAFAICSELTTVSFPVATSIGNNAFQYCYALTTVSFPKATSIGYGAFYNCSALTTVSLPEVTSIGNNAFQSCSTLTTVVLGNESLVATAGTNMFYSTDNAIIFVPDTLVSDYKIAINWSEYESRIKGISELPTE